jgi:hypothetical protein
VLPFDVVMHSGTILFIVRDDAPRAAHHHEHEEDDLHAIMLRQFLKS